MSENGFFLRLGKDPVVAARAAEIMQARNLAQLFAIDGSWARGDRWQFRLRLKYLTKNTGLFADARQALLTESLFIRNRYRQAISESGAHVLVDGIVGSLAYGAASLTTQSDVDAVAIVAQGQDVKAIRESIDGHLQAVGIKSNVRVYSPELLASEQVDEALKTSAISWLYTGVTLHGDRRAHIPELALQTLSLVYPSTVRWYRDDEFKFHQEESPHEAYIHRAYAYAHAYSQRETVIQAHPELFPPHYALPHQPPSA